ncbi:hypothetical protein GCM10010176_104760 [Nonomuraea spiralis]|nr:hypothetical protein GCM10010176_104760 [Nonomuraea spiralis]
MKPPPVLTAATDADTAHRRLVRTFVAAAQTGDLTELEELLAADVTG